MILRLTGERHLGLFLLELIEDFAVGHIAHLKIFLDRDTLAVTDTTFAFRRHGITNVITLTHIAVNSPPAIFAVAVLVCPWGPLMAIG